MSKPFISKNNPFNENSNDGEIFSYSYLGPKYWITWIFLGLSFIVAHLPFLIRKFLGEKIGAYLYRFSNQKKKIIKINLSLTFNNISEREINEITKMYFKNVGYMYMNLPSLWWKSDINIQKTIKKQNLQLIDNILSSNQSVILLAPHTLSLDYGGRALSEYNLLSMYKPFKNSLLNWFIGKSRSKDTDKVIVYPRNKTSIKNIIRKMKKPSVLYFLADEDISPEDSIFSKFFDTNKTSLKSVSKLAKITNSKVLTCICHYDVNSDTHTFNVMEEIKNFPSGNIEEDCVKINSILENQILMDKTQYMWTLRIYKHREDGSDIYKL
tara:strand:- start:4634 stop:5608 length:975 start_codon:yes stop_codon:yes gene_type:complete